MPFICWRTAGDIYHVFKDPFGEGKVEHMVPGTGSDTAWGMVDNDDERKHRRGQRKRGIDGETINAASLVNPVVKTKFKRKSNQEHTRRYLKYIHNTDESEGPVLSAEYLAIMAYERRDTPHGNFVFERFTGEKFGASHAENHGCKLWHGLKPNTRNHAHSKSKKMDKGHLHPLKKPEPREITNSAGIRIRQRREMQLSQDMPEVQQEFSRMTDAFASVCANPMLRIRQPKIMLRSGETDPIDLYPCVASGAH